MGRKYDSSRRRRAAEQTRERILQAALRLHWQGITEYAPLAEAAGCSLPTVRKHFPTREALFRNCTRAFAETLELPDLDALAAIMPGERRLESCVSELCRVHEAMSGYAWLAERLRQESPVLEAEMRAYEGLADAVTEMLAGPDPRRAAIVRGLLDFLTYRALRRAGGLSAADARLELIRLLRPYVTDVGGQGAQETEEQPI